MTLSFLEYSTRVGPKMELNIRQSKRSLWLVYFAPIVLVVCTVAILTSLSVRDTLRSLGDSYAKNYSRIVLNVSMENKSALVAPQQCGLLQQVLRYEREILEMQIVSNKQIICSSLGEIGTREIVDIETLSHTSQMIQLASMPMSKKDISVAVITRKTLNEQEYYAVSLIDLDYLRATLGYRTDYRTSSTALFIGEDSAPHNTPRASGWLAYVAETDIPLHQIQVIASDELILEKTWFYSLAAIPGTLAMYIGFFFIRRHFIRNQGFHNEVKQAIRRKEFILHYQPQMDCSTGELSGVEALVRWMHPERGLIYPDVFIPVLEEFDLINQLTDLVVERAISDFSPYSFARAFHLGINFPPGYFVSSDKQRFLIEQAALLRKRGIHLGLEITERQLLDNRAKSAIEYLRQSGLEVLIDDFGTGQTSLAMLETTPIDYLKIDKCFVDSIGSQSVTAPVLDAIISMAIGLDLKIVAEGVEEQSQADYLVSRGVCIHQGYLYSKPMPFEALSLPVE
ncbi:TPA: EAL domain-containing protein [Vibrio vulnificus]|nr:EAL domain-containing protein [Vibrio vulnificus]HAS6028870.1 EAL domain-containing protein [Vibrio vulnificus]HAS6046945.1 EAL domain-containing protein [Vibrio vulnificus]HAS6114372.1 EAL domain-containing protein [Vibrio vulnificus]HAS6123499.1 EAL domain-containing protein [Vibrio vulnificus]